jgi:hypothetical protein
MGREIIPLWRLVCAGLHQEGMAGLHQEGMIMEVSEILIAERFTKFEKEVFNFCVSSINFCFIFCFQLSRVVIGKSAASSQEDGWRILV